MKLEQQIAAVEREIALRERVYPRLTARGALAPEAAAYQLNAMRAVKITLELAGEQALLLAGLVQAMVEDDMPVPVALQTSVSRLAKLLNPGPEKQE